MTKKMSGGGKVLIASPVRDKKRRKDFKAALEKANQRYGRILKRLAH